MKKLSETEFKNILVVRTDRLGDVVLTTPAIGALRKAFPKARISMMVSPATVDLLRRNPYLDEVIVYDRFKEHHGLKGYWKFVLELRQKKFDLAVIYHTKRRINLVCFLAGIPSRIGYRNDKFGFLLTHGLPDTRPLGIKHEVEYCLDVLKPLGVPSDFSQIQLFLDPEAEQWAERIFSQYKISSSDSVIAIHSGASCHSRIWPVERYAELIKRLAQYYSAKIIIIGGKDSLGEPTKLKSLIPESVIDLAGQTTVPQLMSLLKRCRLLVSNDSGPVHVAVGLGTPVISIFGRNQPGISPNRWRPLGPRDIFLNKQVGCEVCLAHRCQKNFQCLLAISVDEVFESAKRILGP